MKIYWTKENSLKRKIYATYSFFMCSFNCFKPAKCCSFFKQTKNNMKSNKNKAKEKKSSCLHFHDINFPGFLTTKRATEEGREMIMEHFGRQFLNARMKNKKVCQCANPI